MWEYSWLGGGGGGRVRTFCFPLCLLIEFMVSVTSLVLELYLFFRLFRGLEGEGLMWTYYTQNLKFFKHERDKQRIRTMYKEKSMYTYILDLLELN